MASQVLARSALGLAGASLASTSGRCQTSFLGTRMVVPRSARRMVMDATKEDTPLPSTKVDIKESDVKQHEKEEPLRVFDNTPAGQFLRPESERRPELGNTDPYSVMRFDGPAPETINNRLAMLGITAAFIGEKLTGLTVKDQVFESNGGLWFLVFSQLFIWASLIPIFKGESPDSRVSGPFNAQAERWNGRLAMVAVVLTLVQEAITHKAAFVNFPLLNL